MQTFIGDCEEGNITVVTIKDIVRRARVSYFTVSGALNGIGVENTENRKNILRPTQEMGYVPSQATINLKKPRSYVIELYFSTISKIASPFVLHDVLTGAYNAVGSKYSVVVRGTGMHKPGTLNPSYFDGIIVLSQRSEDMEFTSRILDKKVPTAIICRVVDVDALNVATDEALAMEQAMDYLLESGHRNIGIVERNPGLDSSCLRCRGWGTFMTGYRLDSDTLPVINGNYRYVSGYTAAKQLLAFRSTALLCSSDEITSRARTAIVETGLKVPNDVSLVGFDNWDMLGYSGVHLTTVERNMGEIVKEGTGVLFRHLDEGIIDNRRIYLNNKLIIRDMVKDPNVEEGKPS